MARSDRPKLPTLNPELVKSEHLAPLTAKPTGVLVTIDKGVLAELYDRLAEAVGAVTRANNRVAGVKKERRCIAAIFATGTAPAGCPKPSP
jgi:hypothetical protein